MKILWTVSRVPDQHCGRPPGSGKKAEIHKKKPVPDLAGRAKVRIQKYETIVCCSLIYRNSVMEIFKEVFLV